jgi:hypothetical protein
MGMETPAHPVTSPLRHASVGVGIGVVVLGLLGLWFWTSERETRALRELPAEERQALYTRTIANLQTVCLSDRAPELVEFCSEQAEIAAALPECDEACRILVHRFYRKPAR